MWEWLYARSPRAPAHWVVEGVPRSALRSGAVEASAPEEVSGWPSAGTCEEFSAKGGSSSASSNVFFRPCQNPLRRSSFIGSSSRVYDGIPFESVRMVRSAEFKRVT
jgi:hypothetical protein